MTDADLISLLRQHLPEPMSGKSQEVFPISERFGKRFLGPLVTNRISTHDFVLGFELARVGEIQNALSVYWKLALARAGVVTDLVAFGPGIDSYLPKELRGNPELWKRLCIVRSLKMLLVEIIPRQNLTGSAWRQYRDNDRMVYGRQLPEGLRQNDPLDRPIITYTDKAPRGEHDTPRSSDEVEAEYPALTPLAHRVIDVIARETASTGRAHMPDTKIEVGYDHRGILCVGDHVGTIYTSRIWDVAEAARALSAGKLPPPHDKDIVRWEMEDLQIGLFSPSDPDDCAAVKDLIPPGTFIKRVEELFLDAVPLLTGMTLKELQHHVLEIPEEHC